MTQPDKQAALSGLAIINACLSGTMQQIISVQRYGAKALDKRQIDFGCIDRAVAAAEALVAAVGPDTAVPAGGSFSGATAAGLLTAVRDIAVQAAPFRPAKERRA